MFLDSGLPDPGQGCTEETEASGIPRLLRRSSCRARPKVGQALWCRAIATAGVRRQEAPQVGISFTRCAAKNSRPAIPPPRQYGARWVCFTTFLVGRGRSVHGPKLVVNRAALVRGRGRLQPAAYLGIVSVPSNTLSYAQGAVPISRCRSSSWRRLRFRAPPERRRRGRGRYASAGILPRGPWRPQGRGPRTPHSRRSLPWLLRRVRR